MAQRPWTKPVNTRPWKTLLISALAGAMIWLLTPVLTSHREPWDVDGSFYIIALLISGAAAGAIAPSPLWAHYAGSFAGQLVYELCFLHVGPLFIIGALFLLGYCVVFSIAAALTAIVRARFVKNSAESS